MARRNFESNLTKFWTSYPSTFNINTLTLITTATTHVRSSILRNFLLSLLAKLIITRDRYQSHNFLSFFSVEDDLSLFSFFQPPWKLASEDLRLAVS